MTMLNYLTLELIGNKSMVFLKVFCLNLFLVTMGCLFLISLIHKTRKEMISFVYQIIFVNSQRENKNLKGNFVLKRSFERFWYTKINLTQIWCDKFNK